MHAGAEGADRQHVSPGMERYLGENRGDVVRFARGAVDAGADLVVGHGPHVLRGMEWYRGRLIAYSLGSLAAYEVRSLEGPLSTSAHPAGDPAWRRDVRDGQARPDEARRARRPRARPDRGRPRRRAQLSREDFGARGVTVSPDGVITR